MSPFSKVDCFTVFAYSTENSDIALESNRFCRAIKGGQDRAIDYVSMRVAALAKHDHVRRFFDDKTALVPVPGSAPWRGEQQKWVGLLLAEALKSRGLTSVSLLVRRTYRMRKSAFSAPGERPTHREHYDSLAIKGISDTAPERITVVDDVLGRGATIMGTVARLREQFPTTVIRSFAALRIKSNFGDGPIVDPCRHRISIGPNGVRRKP